MTKGFTLIELLIVIAILAILATAVVLVINPAELLRQARDGQRLADFKNLKSAVDLYLVRNTSATTNLGPQPAGTCAISSLAYPTWRISIPNSVLITPVQGRAAMPFVNGSSNGVFPVQPADPKAINGDGWVSVNFNEVQGTSPLSRLPVDPINFIPAFVSGNPTYSQLTTPNVLATNVEAANFYAYQCQGLYYEFTTNMESKKYDSNFTCTAAGSDPVGVECLDGGANARYCTNTVCLNAGTDFTMNQSVANVVYEVGNDPGLDL
jgi:prepilin-type N-terminal cleavage/methylation domain-containing protein